MSEKPTGRKGNILTRISPPRVKRILQTDEEIGKMANPVPAVIARSLEVFIEKLLTKSVDVTQQRLAKTLTPQHIKECAKLEPSFRFLQGVMVTVPDLNSESGGGQSTITSHQGSSAMEFGSTGASTSSSATTSTSASHRVGGGIGAKRQSSKNASVESTTDGGPVVKARRGRPPKRSVGLDADFADLSDGDGEPSDGEESEDKSNRWRAVEPKLRRRENRNVPDDDPSTSTSSSSKAAQPRSRSQEEVFEFGPTSVDGQADEFESARRERLMLYLRPSADFDRPDPSTSSSSSTSTSTELVDPTETIAGRWSIVDLLGKGGFGSVYKAIDKRNGETCALKIESTAAQHHPKTKMEVAVLLELRGVSRHVCGILGCGLVRGRMHFLAMQMVGSSLDDLRERMPNRRLQPSTVVRIAMQAVEAIRDVHTVGYVHRDVKPSNLAIGRTEIDRRTIYILDFGSARQHLIKNREDGIDEVRPQRENVGFCGTVHYASINAHKNTDLGRHDDLWSLLYGLIELRRGSLPWDEVDDPITVARMKTTMTIREMVDSNEDADTFEPMSNVLKEYSYETSPDYEWFIRHLLDVQTAHGYETDGKFEWEEIITATKTATGSEKEEPQDDADVIGD